MNTSIGQPRENAMVRVFGKRFLLFCILEYLNREFKDQIVLPDATLRVCKSWQRLIQSCHLRWNLHLVTFDELLRRKLSLTLDAGTEIFFDPPRYIRMYHLDIHLHIEDWFRNMDITTDYGQPKQRSWATTGISIFRFSQKFVVAGVSKITIWNHNGCEFKHEMREILFDCKQPSPILSEWKSDWKPDEQVE
jgi:hypothetical protein